MASISEILLAQGRHAAESKRARAGAWQPLMQHLANLPGQVMQDRAAERAATEAAFDRQQQRDVREQTLAKGEQELQAGTRAATTAQATADQKRQMNEILASEGVVGQDQTIDAARAQQIAQERGYTDIVDDILSLAQEHNAAVSKGVRDQTQFDQQQTDRRQTTNQQGVRRMIGESVSARGGEPMSPAEQQTVRGMAFQERIPKADVEGLFPEPVKPDTRALNQQLADAIRRGDKAEMNVIRQAIRVAAEEGREPADTSVPAGPEGVTAPLDPSSQDLMSQAGLTYNGFLALTGRMSQLPRDKETRNRASAEVQAWARERGMDVATLGSQYKAYNEALENNIQRYNRTLLAEGEIAADVTNLLAHVKETGLGDVRAINAAKQWLKGELNDPNAAQYAFFLNQLVNDIALYNAASQGRATLQSDVEDAKGVVQRGVSAGSLTGMQKAITQSVEKMGTVLEGAVNRSRKNVWDLFGVGDKYKPKGGANATPTAGKPMTVGGFTVTVD